MSKESLPQHSEEVDLGSLFNAIGRLLERFYDFILSIFKFIFSIIINISKAFIDNFKIIVATMIVAAGLGYGMEKIKKPKYESKMLVRTYFDAKYQLSTNLQYYNALLKEENYSTLSEIFKLDENIVGTIVGFDMEPGPETENSKLVQYDRFMSSLDSTRAQNVTYEDYLENRDLLSGNLFMITVESFDKGIFTSLEKGIHETFNNDYSSKKMEKRDAMLQIRKDNIINSLEEIDSLKNVYISIIQDESKTTRAKISLGDGFPLQQEKSETKEFQLLNKEIALRDELRRLEEEKIEENVFFDVISSFQEVGNRVSKITSKYTLIFPALAFILLCLYYLAKNYINYVKAYKG